MKATEVRDKTVDELEDELIKLKKELQKCIIQYKS